MGSHRIQKGSQACGKDSCGWVGVGEEEAHFSLKGALSPPIISHCPVET